MEDTTLNTLSIADLREKWAQAWGMKPHKGIGRSMLEKSILFRVTENQERTLKPEHQQKLRTLVTQYKRNPNCFDHSQYNLKPGMRIVKNYQGRRHSILVKQNGFEYKEKHYTSLSSIAFDITGTRWNGYIFFGLKQGKTS